MTKKIELVLETENKDDMKQVLNDILLDCSGFIKTIQIEDIPDKPLEIPKFLQNK